jgi:two-component system, OmpR family, sensor kinase
VSRLSIRARLTIAFAAAMVLVLVAAGLFVYLRLKADLDEGVDAGLSARADAAATVARAPSGGLGEAGPAGPEGVEESFAQLLGPGGRVLDSGGGAREPGLAAQDVRRAQRGTVVLERRVAGIEGTARVLGRPATGRDGPVVVVVGQSLDDRDETLAGVVTSFAVGGPAAVLLASLIGYLLAAAGLRPVEAMRRRAREVSLVPGGKRLPLPAARDEVRRLGETLNEMLDRLRGSFERERRFVADASHELRTPVAVLKAELEGALRAGGHDAQVRQSLVAALEECDHLAQLAEDLLVVARAGEGELPLRPESLEVNALLETVRERFAERARGQGRRIRVDGADGLRLEADPLRLRQALGKLVDNALRHGEGEVVLGSRGEDGSVSLEVSDSGPGFGADIAGRAFERFARGDAARTRGGTGLGMAIVKTIAEAHGGSASIVPADGATVRIFLPNRSQGRLSGASYGGSVPDPPRREHDERQVEGRPDRADRARRPRGGRRRDRRGGGR